MIEKHGEITDVLLLGFSFLKRSCFNEENNATCSTIFDFQREPEMVKQVLLIPKVLAYILETCKINLLHCIVMFLLTFESLDLQLRGIFLYTVMASPLTSEINSSWLKHAVV